MNLIQNLTSNNLTRKFSGGNAHICWIQTGRRNSWQQLCWTMFHSHLLLSDQSYHHWNLHWNLSRNRNSHHIFLYRWLLYVIFLWKHKIKRSKSNSWNSYMYIPIFNFGTTFWFEKYPKINTIHSCLQNIYFINPVLKISTVKIENKYNEQSFLNLDLNTIWKFTNKQFLISIRFLVSRQNAR